MQTVLTCSFPVNLTTEFGLKVMKDGFLLPEAAALLQQMILKQVKYQTARCGPADALYWTLKSALMKFSFTEVRSSMQTGSGALKHVKKQQRHRRSRTGHARHA